jgi:hypothetical protein
MPSNFYPDWDDVFAGTTYPTLNISIEVKKDPKDSKWLFSRVRSNQISNGRFDTDVCIVDEGGDLVALSRHVSVILERKIKPVL